MDPSYPHFWRILFNSGRYFFDIRNINFAPDAIPTNGYEYLLKVFVERHKYPRVMRATNLPDTCNFIAKEFPKNEVLAKPLNMSLLPEKNWKIQVIWDFRTLREEIQVARLSVRPSRKYDLSINQTQQDWWNCLYNSRGWAVKEPQIALVCRLNQRQISKLVRFHSIWLEEERLPLTLDIASWLFLLFACLDDPIDQNTYYALRVVSKLSWARRSIIEEDHGEDGLLLYKLNQIITVVGMFFGQADLADSD